MKHFVIFHQTYDADEHSVMSVCHSKKEAERQIKDFLDYKDDPDKVNYIIVELD